MALITIQVIGLAFAVFMMYFMFLHFKRREFSKVEYSLWMVFWVAFIAVTLFPQMLDPLLVQLHIVRALDFFIIAGFLFLIFISVNTYTIVRKNQQKVEEIVRESALNKK